MSAPIEIIETNEKVVKCDGGREPLGHPAVYLNLGVEGQVTCPYCSKCFVKKAYSSITGKRVKSLWRASL